MIHTDADWLLFQVNVVNYRLKFYFCKRLHLVTGYQRQHEGFIVVSGMAQLLRTCGSRLRHTFLKLLKLVMTSVKSVLCVRFSSLFLFVLVVLNLVTRAMVHVFLRAKLKLLFSFFVLVNFYSLIACVYLVHDFYNKYIIINPSLTRRPTSECSQQTVVGGVAHQHQLRIQRLTAHARIHTQITHCTTVRSVIVSSFQLRHRVGIKGDRQRRHPARPTGIDCHRCDEFGRQGRDAVAQPFHRDSTTLRPKPATTARLYSSK